jgi:uncharacterized protein
MNMSTNTSTSILSRGKSIKQAIDLGLNILSASMNDVSIEVIQQGSKGFLKVGSKPAIVKLTKNRNYDFATIEEIILDDKERTNAINVALEISDSRNEDVSQDSTVNSIDESESTYNDGKVWVKDNKIYGKPTEYHYPTITVGKGIRLLQNGELVSGTTLLTNENDFEIERTSEKVDTKWSIRFDENKVHAILTVQPGSTKSYHIQDVKPDYHIDLVAKEIITVENDLDYKTVLEELEKLEVKCDLNHNEIMKAVNSNLPGEYIIASGKLPSEGENGKIELLIDVDKKKELKEKSDGRVDFRDIQHFPTVQKGQVIATIKARTIGEEGLTVTNHTIMPKKTYPIIVQQGPGMVIIENGTKIVATETGRPEIFQQGLLVKVSIIPKLVHNGDVNLLSGNIRFKGDIDISGNIEEGMVVESEGIVNVTQNVNMASVSSKHAIIIHQNVIGSTLTAGKQNMYVSELLHTISMLHEQMIAMNLSIKQIVNLPAFKTTDYKKYGLLPLIRLLLEKRFSSIRTYVNHYSFICNQGKGYLDEEWFLVNEDLKLLFTTSIPNNTHSLTFINGFIGKVETIIEKYSQNKDSAYIALKYALNSTIYSEGDVYIEGQGCYNSKIHAGGCLTVKGILRGGEVYARKGANIFEVGSKSGTKTKIMVPYDQKIAMDYVKEGTTVQVGKVQYTFEQDRYKVIVQLDHENRLIFC